MDARDFEVYKDHEGGYRMRNRVTGHLVAKDMTEADAMALFEMGKSIAVLTAERDALKAAIVAAVSKPHPTWCKARQGQECTCYQKELRAKLETK